jgi:hypothetical protein
MLKELYDYEESTDTFKNIICKYLPVESDFLKFWEATIEIMPPQSDLEISDVDIGSELEVDEICMLFKNWVKNQKNQDDLLLSNGNITEDAVLKIIKHFFHTVEIEEDKYVLSVTCNMWSKVKDIEKSFLYMKQEIQYDQVPSLISFDEAYQMYCKFCGIKSYKYIISKRFFEKYLCHRIGCHIVYDTFIETTWLINKI